jgi:hypothetical protein
MFYNLDRDMKHFEDMHILGGICGASPKRGELTATGNLDVPASDVDVSYAIAVLVTEMHLPVCHINLRLSIALPCRRTRMES